MTDENVGIAAPAALWGWTRSTDYRTATRRTYLTAEEAHAVVARNRVACVRYPLSDSATRTSRVQYARHAGALYIPAWTSLDSWYDTRPPELECDVSEVEGRSCWRYVWLRGLATPLHPTGDLEERQAWREGITILRRALPNIPQTDELAVANFGIVRLDIESCDGAVVGWE